MLFIIGVMWLDKTVMPYRTLTSIVYGFIIHVRVLSIALLLVCHFMLKFVRFKGPFFFALCKSVFKENISTLTTKKSTQKQEIGYKSIELNM